MTRDELILSLKPLVLRIAKALIRRLDYYHRMGMMEDFVQCGWVGAIRAIDGFNPDKDRELEHYASFRIRGEILEYIRLLDWASRAHRRRIKQGLEQNKRIEQIIPEFDRSDEWDSMQSVNSHIEAHELLSKSHLTEQESRVLAGYYWGDRTLKAIGKDDLRVSNARSSKIHKAAIKKLAAAV